MTSFRAVLIYDGDCPYCSIAARALERADDVGAISWYDDAAQAFLDAQFEAAPFAMFLVDAESGTVAAGRAAAEDLADRAGTPSVVQSLVRDNYETIARVVGAASGRDRDPADYHETYPLTDAGRAAFDVLATEAQRRDITSTEGV